MGLVTRKEMFIVQTGHQRPQREKLSLGDKQGSRWSARGTVREACVTVREVRCTRADTVLCAYTCTGYVRVRVRK